MEQYTHGKHTDRKQVSGPTKERQKVRPGHGELQHLRITAGATSEHQQPVFEKSIGS